jgi:hypothetical protein
MHNPAASMTMPVMRRRLAAHRPRFTVAPIAGIGRGTPHAPGGHKTSVLLRKNPAWIDRDL